MELLTFAAIAASSDTVNPAADSIASCDVTRRVNVPEDRITVGTSVVENVTSPLLSDVTVNRTAPVEAFFTVTAALRSAL